MTRKALLARAAAIESAIDALPYPAWLRVKDVHDRAVNLVSLTIAGLVSTVSDDGKRALDDLESYLAHN